MPPKLFFLPPMERREIKSAADLPKGKNWQYEVKFDGYRCIAIKQNNEVQLLSRRGLPFNKFLNLHRVLLEQPPKSFILDGEIVALDAGGHSNFNILQNAGSTLDVHFYAFDLLHIDDEPLLDLSLVTRAARLRSAFVPNEFLHLLRPVEASIGLIIQKVRQFGFEGIVAKQPTAPLLPLLLGICACQRSALRVHTSQ